jgi:hypothetical protein
MCTLGAAPSTKRDCTTRGTSRPTQTTKHMLDTLTPTTGTTTCCNASTTTAGVSKKWTSEPAVEPAVEPRPPINHQQAGQAVHAASGWRPLLCCHQPTNSLRQHGVEVDSSQGIGVGAARVELVRHPCPAELPMLPYAAVQQPHCKQLHVYGMHLHRVGERAGWTRCSSTQALCG